MLVRDTRPGTGPAGAPDRPRTPRRSQPRIATLALSILVLLPLAACDIVQTTAEPADPVTDLTVTATTDFSVTFTWTQVGDGVGTPAWYEIRRSASPFTSWEEAAVVREGDCAAPVQGGRIGAEISCTVEGLEAGRSYEFQMASYRRDWRELTATRTGIVDARTTGGANDAPTADFSEDCTELTCTFDASASEDPDGPLSEYAWDLGDGSEASGDRVEHTYAAAGTYEVTLTVTGDAGLTDEASTTVVIDEPEVPSSSGDGIWISPSRLSSLPTSGSAWENLKSEADGSCGSVDLSDQDQGTNVCIMAKALVFARTGQSGYRSDVVSAIEQIVSSGTYDGRALALGRELVAYVIAADLIDLQGYDSSLDGDFRSKLRELLTTHTDGGPGDLVECHEDRPNNWGTHCGASRAAVAAYLGDSAELERVAQVFRGWVGDRSSYAGFRYGDLAWQCDPDRPVGINPAGCTKDGNPIGGVLPDDQRRGGGFEWPPPPENYVWEGLQGALAQAVILHRAGYDVFQWEDRALYRAVRWLHEHAGYPAGGDDTWQPHVINHFYGTDFPEPTSSPGKNVGWTDWTHR